MVQGHRLDPEPLLAQAAAFLSWLAAEVASLPEEERREAAAALLR